MGLNWPGASMVGGDMTEDDRTAVRELLDEFADRAATFLGAMGLPPHTSALWRPWNLVAVVDAEKVMAAFSVLTGGMADIKWLDRKTELFPAQELARAVREELGQQLSTLVTLPLPGAADRAAVLELGAQQHARLGPAHGGGPMAVQRSQGVGPPGRDDVQIGAARAEQAFDRAVGVVERLGVVDEQDGRAVLGAQPGQQRRGGGGRGEVVQLAQR